MDLDVSAQHHAEQLLHGKFRRHHRSCKYLAVGQKSMMVFRLSQRQTLQPINVGHSLDKRAFNK